MKIDKRRDRGAKLLREMLGKKRAKEISAVWEKICPEFEDYVLEFVSGEIWSRPNLDRRTKSLVTIATLAAMGRGLALELNIRMAFNNGATREDIVETLLQIAPYAGFPAVWEGLSVLHKIVQEKDDDKS